MQYLSSGVLIRSMAEQDYVPRVFEGYVADIDVDGKNVALAFWDTEFSDRLRPLSYANSHVILICFAIDFPDSFDNVKERVRTYGVLGSMGFSTNIVVQWIPEVAHFCPRLPILLVGCKQDLRSSSKVIEELKITNQRPVTPEEVRYKYDDARAGRRL
jgi:Ras homolog gene family, member A